MLIKSYGTFWNPEIIDWGSPGAGNKGSLMGTVVFDNALKKNIDFWEAKGIYVLSNEFRAVYVGRATRTPLGCRLRDHITDRLAGRWDMFSWFSSSAPRKVRGGVTEPGKRQISPQTYISTFEALAILIADPPLNRRRETFKNAYEVIQFGQQRVRSMRSYLEEILHAVGQQDVDD